MPWPTTVPPNTRVDATALTSNHAGDHNTIANALTDLIAQLTPIYYGEITSAVSVTVTTAATAVNVINPGNISYDGFTTVLIEFITHNLQAPASAQILLNLWDGNTDLGYFGQIINPSAGVMGVPCFCRRRLTPTAGLHNYNVRAWVTTGSNGAVQAGPGGAGQNPPASFRIVRT